MKFRSIVVGSAALGLVCFAVAAQAEKKDLQISNATQHEISFDVNGHCSKQIGVVASYSIKRVPEKDFMAACASHTAPCEMYAFTGKDCQGEPFVQLNYYLNRNYVEVNQLKSGIGVGVSGYDLFFN